MANRIIIGNKNGNYTFQISKIGKNVLDNLNDEDYIINLNSNPSRVLLSGQYSGYINNLTESAGQINIPNYGYRPIIIAAIVHWYGPVGANIVSKAGVTYKSLTNIEFGVSSDYGEFANERFDNPFMSLPGPYTLYWYVLNRKL